MSLPNPVSLGVLSCCSRRLLLSHCGLASQRAIQSRPVCGRRLLSSSSSGPPTPTWRVKEPTRRINVSRNSLVRLLSSGGGEGEVTDTSDVTGVQHESSGGDKRDESVCGARDLDTVLVGSSETGDLDSESLKSVSSAVHHMCSPRAKESDFPEDKENNSTEGLDAGSALDEQSQLHATNEEQEIGSKTSDDVGPTNLGTINLSDFPRTEDGGIIIYPEVHFHGNNQTQPHHHRDNRPHPPHISHDSDSDKGGESSTVSGKEYDIHNLLYNIHKSQATKISRREVRQRVTAMSVEELVQFLEEQNAVDICVIEVPPECDYVRYFVICSGLGTRHVGRMADSLVTELKRVRVGRDQRRVRVEGRESQDWMAVDLGSMVVHLMLEATREKYEFEKLWTLGDAYDDQCRLMRMNAATQQIL